MQPVQQVITNHGDTTTGQTRPHTQTRKLAQSDKPIIMVSKTTHQTHQTRETDPHALNEQGHMRMDCKQRVYCTNCRTANHDTKACRKHHNNIPSPTNSHIQAEYHPTAIPTPLIGTAAAAGQQTQQTGATSNGPLFQNLFDIHPPRTSTTIHTPFNGTSPAPSANMTEAIMQILTQVANNTKKDDISKQMMKNIKIFDGTSKAECITWLSQVEAAVRFSNTPFC